jgi:hypothetical protein
MVDLLGLRGDLSPEDFVFRVGAGDGNWSEAPLPVSTTRRAGAGVGGSDRVTLVWADGAIKNTWLQVTLKPNARTGLAVPELFSFGNLVGMTGDGGPSLGWGVSALDLAAVKRALNSNSDLAGRFDVNRDGRVNALDLAAVRGNLNRTLAAVAAPSAGASSAASVEGMSRFLTAAAVDAGDTAARRVLDESLDSLG